MSAKSPSRPTHLFVVKEPSGTSTRMVSAESLSADQHRIVLELIGRSETPGVLVGAFVSDTFWDYRPLILHEGVVSLLRFSNPQLALERDKYSSLKSLNSKLASLSLGNCLMGFGENEGQIWVRRRYFQHTLADGGLEWLPFHPLQFVQKLVRALRLLHDNKVIHGHICLTNVSFDERGPVLMDHGWSSLSILESRSQANLAPELQLIGQASEASDVYGLGQVIKEVLSKNLGARESQLVERMLLSDPASRPSVKQVLETFSPQEIQPTPYAPTSVKPGVASGKLLSRAELSSNSKMAAPTPIASETKAKVEHQVKIPRIISAPNQPRPKVEAPIHSTVSEVPVRQIDVPQPMPEMQAVQSQSPESKSLFLPAILLSILAAVSVLYRFGAFEPRRTLETQQAIPYANYWLSNQPSLMQQVAQAAMNQDSEAQLVIVSDALKGNSRPLVRSTLLRTALNPLWERQLSAGDRAIVLQMALNKLLPASTTPLPPLREAHPAVLLALASELPDLDRERGSAEFSAVPLERLATLPNPYGYMFNQLNQLGIKSLDHVAARALAHILAGDINDISLSAFIASSSSKSEALARIAILLPLMEHSSKVADVLFAALSTRANPLLEVIQWFSLEELADWSKVEKFVVFGLMVGIEKFDMLSLAQNADLLTFPDKTVRLQAIKRLKGGLLPKTAQATLQFLASSDNLLSRFQTISLVSALKFEGEVGYSLLAKVLDTRPEPKSILNILLARTNLGKADPFSLDLARYLARNKWDASLVELKALATHPERYARVLAYSRLDPRNPDHLPILQNAAVVEPHEALRKQVQDKLATVAADDDQESTGE